MTTTESSSMNSSSSPLAVRLQGVRRSFGDFVALGGVDLDMREGEFVALVGKSGSGKTTLLRILAGLDSPDVGTVLVPQRRTVVFQEPRLIPSKKVWRNVVLGLPRSAENRAAARKALEVVGLSHRENVWPATLSGGEAQRVALARALVRQPKLLLLDEPFAALDALTRRQMQTLIGELIENFQPATLIVTHDVEEAILLADRIILLREGHFAHEVTVDIPRPRRVGGAVFDELRLSLLQELGVDE